MSDFKQPHSFRQMPVTVTIGSDDNKKEIQLGNLSWAEHKKLMSKIYSIVFDTSALPVIIENIGNTVQTKVSGKNVDPLEAINSLMETITEKVMQQNDTAVTELLEILTQGKLTEQDTGMMQAAEILGLISFLLNRHFEPVKNFNASLSSTLPKRNETK